MKTIGGKTPVNETLIFNYKDTVSAKGAKGNDLYVMTSAQTKNVTINDTVGKNTLVLTDGLGITGMKTTSTSLDLTFENNVVVSVLKPNNFTFKLGGTVQNNKLINQPKETFSFKQFINEINMLTQSHESKNIDKLGSIESSEIINAGNSGITFTGNPLTASRTYVQIDNFGKNDNFTFSGITAKTFEQNAMVSSDEKGNVNIIFNTHDTGELYKITLTGIVSPENSIFDLTSFNQLSVGDIIFV